MKIDTMRKVIWSQIKMRKKNPMYKSNVPENIDPQDEENEIAGSKKKKRNLNKCFNCKELGHFKRKILSCFGLNNHSLVMSDKKCHWCSK